MIGITLLSILLTLIPAAAWGAELTVSAAASLTNVFQELGRRFSQQHPGDTVVFNFGASGALLQQLAQGAPVDLLAAADQQTMDQAQDRGLIVAATRKNFVSNRLMLIIPAAAKLPVKTPRDLKLPEVKRIAVGNPATVPVGRYTQEALAAAGLWEALTPKLIKGQSVRQVLDYVSRGEVDAGFVFATDAVLAKEKVTAVQEIQGHQPIVYPLALVAGGKHQALGQRFLDYLLSPEAQETFSRYGFGRP